MYGACCCSFPDSSSGTPNRIGDPCILRIVEKDCYTVFFVGILCYERVEMFEKENQELFVYECDDKVMITELLTVRFPS